MGNARVPISLRLSQIPIWQKDSTSANESNHSRSARVNLARASCVDGNIRIHTGAIEEGELMLRAICFAAAVLGVWESQQATAQLPLRIQIMSNLPGSPLGEEIKKMDIMDRPNRIGHFYGNAVRRRGGRTAAAVQSPMPAVRQPQLVYPQPNRVVPPLPTPMSASITNPYVRATPPLREIRPVQIGFPRRSTLQR